METLPEPVCNMVSLIQEVLTPELLTPEWFKKASESTFKYTGQCVNACGALWYLGGGTNSGWRWRNIPYRVWSGGPHYFLIHSPTQLLVDPTAEQYGTVSIPYALSEGRAPATRGRDAQGLALPPKSARVVVERILKTRNGAQLAAALKEWSLHSGQDLFSGNTL